MNPLITALIATYLLGTVYFFINWLKFFRRTPRLSPENWFLSIVLLVIVTTLWPFVAPISWISSINSLLEKRLTSLTPESGYKEELIPAASKSVDAD